MARMISLRQNGEVKAAEELERMLNGGTIVVEDNPKPALYPDGSSYVPGAFVPQDGSKIVINKPSMQPGVRSADLEALLLHEWVHVDDAHQKIPGNEQHATQVTAEYARRRAKKRMPDGSETDWPSIVRDQEGYGKRFAPRDAGRLGGRTWW